jgi:hypothetical protein
VVPRFPVSAHGNKEGETVIVTTRCRGPRQSDNSREITMTMPAAVAVIEERNSNSTVAWGAIFAGGVVAAAMTLVLLALGTGLGFSIVSPWSDSGVSVTTFTWTAALYLIVVAMIASTFGGLVTGWLRAPWSGLTHDQAYFRDTVHGFLAWAVATVFSAALLGAATTHLLAGATAGVTGGGTMAAAQSAAPSGPSDIYIDRLLRPEPGATPQAQPQSDQIAVRAELTRLFANGLRRGGDFSAADRTYVVQVVSRRTGLSQAEAEKRVNEVIAEAKAAADAARRATVKLSLWLTASLLVGAFSASLAGTEGGRMRDGR